MKFKNLLKLESLFQVIMGPIVLLICILGALSLALFWSYNTQKLNENYDTRSEQYFAAIQTTSYVSGQGPALARTIASLGADSNVDLVLLIDLKSLNIFESNKPELKNTSAIDMFPEFFQSKRMNISKRERVLSQKCYVITAVGQMDLFDQTQPEDPYRDCIILMKFDVSEELLNSRHLLWKIGGTYLFGLLLIVLIMALIVRSSVVAPLQLIQEDIKTFGKTQRFSPGGKALGILEFLELRETFLKMVHVLSDRSLLIKKQQDEIAIEKVKSVHSAKLASLGEMSAGIAHEINNPLAIISGSVGLLSKFKDNPEKFASKTEAIQKSCDRIARIVSGLKKFSRSDDRTIFSSHGLKDIAREVLILTESKAKRFSTPVTIESSTQAQIMCDEVEIEQVLVNLINNSIDAVKAQPERWVKVSVFEEDASVVLRVMDSGPGIPENVRAKLFDPFFTTKKVGEGTGLGLSITKGILDEHKATITVVAECPNTCFEIRFPKAEAIKNAA